MKSPRLLLSLLGLGLAATAAPRAAHATGVVQRGQFCTTVTAGRCTDDAAALSHNHTAIYWVSLDNAHGAEVHLTIVWSLDGHVVHRQNIVTRGRATWAMQPLRSANAVSVSILDESGTQLHTDQATISH